jgi:hypothetical protein
MDFDFIFGSGTDQKSLPLRDVIASSGPGGGPHLVVTSSPLAGIETILATLGPGGEVGRLRIFNSMGGSSGISFLTSQLVRLQGRFEPDGSVEIFTASSSSPGTVKGQVSVGGIGSVGSQIGFQGGFQFGSATQTGATPGLNALHLTSLLDVPVRVSNL